ncbi:MAG: peptidylprolyl isomerase [Casimicrobiaceae bacterium]
MEPSRLRSDLSILALVLGGVAAVASAGVTFAQFTTQAPRPGPDAAPVTSPGPAAALRSSDKIVPLDRVVAVVNDEALTQYEVNDHKGVLLGQMKASNVTPPPADTFEKQVLERLVTERALLQFAKDNGVKVDDQQVERTILRIAQENKLGPEEFRRVLEREKIPYAKYRESIRREVTIQRVREREVDSRVAVSDAEVDNYLATVAAQAGGENEYNLAHILVTVPEQAAPEQIDARRRRAEDALREVKDGKPFSQIAAAFSDAPDAVQGGTLGWRTPARLPTVFNDVVRGMKNGEVSNVVRSAGGFHIVKLNETRSLNAPTVVEQTKARHILVRVNEITSEAEAKAKIDRIRDRLETGAKFDEQAKINSEDPSSSKGGELGWIGPGDTVPEFEQAIGRLKPGEVSMPVRSPFGWHLIQVAERRTQDVTQERKRDQARNALRQRKADEQFQEFVRQVRDRAYVEYKVDDR